MNARKEKGRGEMDEPCEWIRTRSAEGEDRRCVRCVEELADGHSRWHGRRGVTVKAQDSTVMRLTDFDPRLTD